MNRFFYDGPQPVSKSLAIRALFLASYSPSIRVLGDSQAQDVCSAKAALRALSQSSTVDCGAAGAVFRFALARASRMRGRYELVGTPRLLSRPHDGLIRALEQLGVRCSVGADRIVLQGVGWQRPRGPIDIDCSSSSQYLSALVLSAWELPFDLSLRWRGALVSDGYYRMTRELVRRFGMVVDEAQSSDFTQVTIGARQSPKGGILCLEPDLSCAFSLAAAAGIAGELKIKDFPENSLQPDRAFVPILKRMNVPISLEGNTLSVSKARILSPIEQDIGSCPDLFPVLAVLCALAQGTSVLHGAPHLAHKESNRIERTAKLLEALGRRCEVLPDGLRIQGRPGMDSTFPFAFDPDQDHRLAMAAAVAALAGGPVKVLHPEVVNKSFPEFWCILQCRNGTEV